MNKGAKDIYDKMTLLYAGALFGYLDIVKLFIDNGADVNEEVDDGKIPLHGAAARGHIDVMEHLIIQGSDVNKADAKGWTPFNAAVQYGHLEAVQYLVAEGAKQHRYDGMTPLYVAAQLGHLDIVKFFISKGTDVNEEGDEGRTPLHVAAAGGHLKVMEYLIQQGSDVNKSEADDWTPFNAAVQEGHIEAVKYLMTQGAKQNIYDGMTPLYAAALYGHLDIVKFFISIGAEVNEEDDNGKIPLHGAAASGHMDVMKYLIQQGSDVNKADASGWTPFNAAVQGGNLGAVKYLMSKEAKQNIYDGMTPLHTAALCGHLDIVKFFISKGTDVNEEEDEGRTPLHGAAAGGHLKVMEYLIQQGSDLNKTDANGWTPSNAAVQYGDVEAVKYLITEGAKQKRYDGMTPLYAAVQFGHLDIVKFFISKGADVNEENDTGRIPLHGAAVNGNFEIMGYLIQQGSDLNKKDAKGWTPSNAAFKYGHFEAVKYLITEGAKQKRYEADMNVRAKDDSAPLQATENADYLIDLEYVSLCCLQRDGPNLTTTGSFVLEMRDADTQSVTGKLAYHVDKAEDGNDCTQAGIGKGGADKLSSKNLPTRTHDVEKDVGLPHVNEHPNPRRGDQNEEEAEVSLSGGHHYGAKHLTTKGYVKKKKKKKVVKMKEADSQSGTGKLASHLDNSEDVNDCTQADIAKRGADKLSSKHHPTRTHDVEKDKGCPNVNEHLSPIRDDPNQEDTEGPLSGGHHCGAKHLATSGNVKKRKKKKMVKIKEADTQARSGQLSSYVDNLEDVYDCTQTDYAEIGVDGLSMKGLPTRNHDVEKDKGPPNVTGHLFPRRGDQNEEDTKDPLSGGCAKKKKGIQMKEVNTESRTGQLASQVDNVEGRNDCNQADNAKRGDDELSLKNIPVKTHDDEESGREEHNPFVHAKLKYPDKGEQDPMQDQIEAMKSPVTTTGADCFSPHGSQTWQYSGFDPPSLQTMGTDGNPSEESESRCPSLLDNKREMIESPSPMNAGNDLPMNGTSVQFKSSSTHPPAVVHQQLYDGNPVSTHGTSSNPVWKIGVIITLAIILAGSPVLVAGSDSIERVTLQAGKPGVVPFLLPRSPNDTSQVVPYYTLGFQSEPRPFSINGQNDIAGFKNPSQLRRFTTSVKDLDTSPCVNLMIDNVDTLDEDGYVLKVVRHNFENIRYETILKKEVDVQIPPGRAQCLITLSGNVDYPYEVHCRATTGSVTTTLTCYQSNQKIGVKGNITDNGLFTSGIFLLLDYTHFSCCSHDVTSDVSETTCNDFVWPHSKETTRQTVNTVPTSVITPTPQIESHLESGACRQFMLPSLWYFTYLFIYLLYVFTIH